MKRPAVSMVAGVLVLAASLTLAAPAFAQADPLPSWNDGAVKKAIVDFVQATTTRSVSMYTGRRRDSAPRASGPSRRRSTTRPRSRVGSSSA